MSKIGVLQFIYCCPSNFTTQYRKVIKSLKKDKCVLLKMEEEVVPNYFSFSKNSLRAILCGKCRRFKGSEGIRVTVTYGVPK